MHACLLVGGAPTNHSGLDEVLRICSFDAVYAVDAGYDALIARGITPTAIFGDFDSLGRVPSGTPDITHIEIYNAHKDFTDMDLALRHAIKTGFRNIVLCDGLSARLDHSLGNLQLMAAAAHNGQRIWGITEDELVLTLDSAGGLCEIEIDAGAQGTCSVISHSDSAEGVCEEGLEYPLENACVSNRALWGISNELIGKPARISLRQGSLWVFLPLREIARISYAKVKLPIQA